MWIEAESTFTDGDEPRGLEQAARVLNMRKI
jgi:hypothetical protein